MRPPHVEWRARSQSVGYRFHFGDWVAGRHRCPPRFSLRWSCWSAPRAAGDDAGAAKTASPRMRTSAAMLGRSAHRAPKRSRTMPTSSRSNRRSSGDTWCAGQTLRTCERAPGPAVTLRGSPEGSPRATDGQRPRGDPQITPVHQDVKRSLFSGDWPEWAGVEHRRQTVTKPDAGGITVRRLRAG